MTRGKEIFVQALRTGDDEIDLTKLHDSSLKDRYEVLKKLETIELDILNVKQDTHSDILEAIDLLRTLEIDIAKSNSEKERILLGLKQDALQLIQDIKTSQERGKTIKTAMRLGTYKEKIDRLKKSIKNNLQATTYIPTRIEKLKVEAGKLEIEIKQLIISINHRRKLSSKILSNVKKE